MRPETLKYDRVDCPFQCGVEGAETANQPRNERLGKSLLFGQANLHQTTSCS